MEENTEDDHHGLQQDIQQIHKVLGENIDLEEEEEEEDSDENEVQDREKDDVYLDAGPSSSGANLSQVASPTSVDSQPVPEFLSLATPMEPSAENLLQINLSYQDMVCTLLDNIKVARKKNAEIQKKVAAGTSTYVKGARPMTHFQKHYFSGHSSMMPPLSDEAREIKLKNLPTPFIQPAKAWTADEDRALYEGVRNDGLQRCMKPLMAKQEILLTKRQQTYGEEKQQITKEINDITTQLEHLKAPEEELLGDRLRDIDWMKISSLHLNGDRTEIECQLRWQNILHPSINMKAWSREEEKRLDGILENAQGRDWTDVINELGTNRSPFDCFSNFQHREISAYVSRPFTVEEDEIISELAQRFKVGNHIQFNKVAFFMDQRLPRQIQNRWIKKLDPESKFGSWTKEEDEALREGIATYGTRWSVLTKVVKGRDSGQIRDRWKYTLNPNNHKGQYTYEEDVALLQCVKENGVGNWVANTKKLTEMIGITRTPNSVLHRFNSLFHSFFKNAKGISLQEGAHMDVLSSMPLNTILDEMIEYRHSLGERKTRQLGTSYRDLYKIRRRRPRTPPPRLMPRNASVTTRQHVLSELDKQLMEAIKPIGWALPCPGHWREFYGTKAVRKQRRHYLFSVLIKAMDINIEGNEALLASMLTNAEGVQTLKEHNLIPKAVATAPPEAKEKTKKDSAYKSPKSVVKSSKSKGGALKSKKGSSSNKAKPSTDDSAKDAKQKGMRKTVPVMVDGDTDQSKDKNDRVDIPSVSEIPQVTSGLLPGSILTLPLGVAPQGNAAMLPANPAVPEANVTELQAPLQKQGRGNVKTELPLQTSNCIFGQGTLQVGGGYLVPLQNYVSQFGSVNVPQNNVVTLMHPRPVQPPVQLGGLQPPLQIGGGMQPPVQLGGGVQPAVQISGLPTQGQQSLPVRAPFPVQRPGGIPQQTGLAIAMSPGSIQPATNAIPTIGLPTTPGSAIPQQPGIIHVPGKGYLIPLNCIKTELGPPSPLHPINPAPTNFPITVQTNSTILDAVVSNQAGQWDKPGVFGRLPTPGTASPTIPSMPSNVPSGAAMAPACPERHLETPTSSTTQVPKPTENSVATGDAAVSLNKDTEVTAAVESSNGDKLVDSAKDAAANRSSQDNASPDHTKSWKFDPTLPILPPNESTIAGLMAILLERKRLEKGASQSVKFKSLNVRRKDNEAPDGLLQEAPSKETDGSASTAPGCEHNDQGEGTHTMDVEDEMSNNKKKEGVSEVRVPVPVGHRKEQSKEDARQAKPKHAESLDIIRKSDWYKTLQPRFLSMFLWPALLSIVGPHRKKVFGLQKKKSPSPQKPVKFAGHTGIQACGSKPGNLTGVAGDADGKTPERRRGRKRDGRRKYKTAPPKTPISTEDDAKRSRKARVKRKREFKATLGVTRVTRSATRKQKGALPSDKERAMYKVDDVRSDIDEYTSPEEDNAEEEQVQTGFEEHPQALMAFGFPSVREIISKASDPMQNDTDILPTRSETADGTEVPPNGDRTLRTDSDTPHTNSETLQFSTEALQETTVSPENPSVQLHESPKKGDESLLVSSELDIRTSLPKASIENVSASSHKMQTLPQSPAVPGNQSPIPSLPQPSKRKRPLEESDLVHTLPKRSKED